MPEHARSVVLLHERPSPAPPDVHSARIGRLQLVNGRRPLGRQGVRSANPGGPDPLRERAPRAPRDPRDPWRPSTALERLPSARAPRAPAFPRARAPRPPEPHACPLGRRACSRPSRARRGSRVRLRNPRELRGRPAGLDRPDTRPLSSRAAQGAARATRRRSTARRASPTTSACSCPTASASRRRCCSSGARATRLGARATCSCRPLDFSRGAGAA